MLDDLRRIFRQSVDAFRSELRLGAPEDQVAEILTAMRKEMVAVRGVISALENDALRTHEELGRERDALSQCERRGAMAKSIGDHETVRVAEEFAVRHREKVRILEQKKVSLEQEIVLRKSESEEMTVKYREADANRFVLLAQLRQAAAREMRSAPPPDEPDPFTEFARMEGRVASTADYIRALDELDDSPPPPPAPDPAVVEARLRELKRRMGKE